MTTAEAVAQPSPRLYARPLRILVTGSRLWELPGLVQHALAEAAQTWLGEIIVVHGQCDPRGEGGYVVPWNEALTTDAFLLGADWHADRYALARGWTPEPHPANWEIYGRSAGHRRNAEMVQLGADLCLGFPRGDSPGTRGCLKMALSHRIPIRTYEG